MEQLAFFLLLALSIPLALWKGGAPERIGAGVILGMWLWQAVGVHFLPSHYSSVDPVPLSTDVLGAVGFGYLALQARRLWPLWATALQMLSLSAHFARWADIAVPKLVYAVMRGAPTFAVMIAILVGTVMHMRRISRHGCDPSWQGWDRAGARSARHRGNFSKSL